MNQLLERLPELVVESGVIYPTKPKSHLQLPLAVDSMNQMVFILKELLRVADQAFFSANKSGRSNAVLPNAIMR